MKISYALAALPFLGLLGGIAFANRVEPFVLWPWHSMRPHPDLGLPLATHDRSFASSRCVNGLLPSDRSGSRRSTTVRPTRSADATYVSRDRCRPL